MGLALLEQMKIRMKRAGVTQAILADELDINPSTLGNYLSGERTMPEATEGRAWEIIDRYAQKKAEAIRKKADEDIRRVVEPLGAVA